MNGDVISEITLDVATKPNEYITVRAKQGDSNSRRIHAIITNNGEIYPVSNESIAKINFCRYDEQTQSFECEIEGDGSLMLPVPSWAIELPYTVTCDVSIIKNVTIGGATRRSRLTTFNFYIDVEAATSLS